MINNISERVWDSIYSFLQKVTGLHIKNEEETKHFIEGVWYVLRTGCQWRLLPPYYGHWRTIHKRYKKWADRGIWSDLMSSAYKRAYKRVRPCFLFKSIQEGQALLFVQVILKNLSDKQKARPDPPRVL